MEVALSGDVDPISPAAEPSLAGRLTLDDGTLRDISSLQEDELRALQWEQERALARRILDAPKGSPQRAEAVRRAYDTVNRIISARIAINFQYPSDQPVPLGLHPRYGRLVVKLLSRRRARGVPDGFFEVGYGSGGLLRYVGERGFPVAGIEVSAAMRARARRLLGPSCEPKLLLGDFLDAEPVGRDPRYGLIYWNDVFEHVPPDEISDYLDKIRDLLVPGGQLLTITPNWHMRPFDITGEFCPPRTEAAGLHLKEYTLREVTALLRRAGFGRVATPWFVVPGRCVLWGDGLAGWKRRFEPCLERLPFRLAKLLARGFGLCYTIATKPG